MAFQMLGPEPIGGSRARRPVPFCSRRGPAAGSEDASRDEPKKAAKQPGTGQPPATEADAIPVHRPDSRMRSWSNTVLPRRSIPACCCFSAWGISTSCSTKMRRPPTRLLGLTLTTRDRTITMAGFPHHQLEAYLHKLLQEGQRVAICEPVEESLARGPIRREVTRVVTPGTMVEEDQVRIGRTKRNHGSRAADRRTGPSANRAISCSSGAKHWFNEAGLAFVAIEDVRRTTPAVAPYVGVLDFIVLRGEEKLLVTVRPHLQAKHITAIRELHELYGPEYKPVRIWPSEGPDGWNWRDYPIDVSASEPAAGTERKPRPKRSRVSKSQ